MKKLLIFCVLLFGMISYTFAQSATLVLDPGKTYTSYSTDVTVGSGATVYYLIKGNQHEPCTQDFEIHLDSISGGTHATTVKLFGTKFGTTYTQIGSTVTWIASTADTTILFSNATANRYRDYKLEVINASGDVTKIDYWKFKLYVE